MKSLDSEVESHYGTIFSVSGPGAFFRPHGFLSLRTQRFARPLTPRKVEAGRGARHTQS